LPANLKNREDALLMAFFHDFAKQFYDPAYRDTGKGDNHNISHKRVESALKLANNNDYYLFHLFEFYFKVTFLKTSSSFVSTGVS